ncbi:MAG: cytochrome c oxidase subunit 3 [Planctomycetota bacterium]|jgi:cytochrome c oxidase subunit 3
MTAVGAEPESVVVGPHVAAGSGSHQRPRHLAHHFDTSPQQFEAAKLGMWLFLATEMLLFGGLFCAYSVYRGNHVAIFEYGSQFLDTRWGAVNTAVLILSSMTMASAVTAAQRGQRRLLIALLMLTFLGGAIFMGIKYIEYHHKFHENLVWGQAFYEKPDWVVAAEIAEADEVQPDEAPAVARPPDSVRGEQLWLAICRSCHGVGGEGVAGQGKDIRGSEFIGGRTDGELLAFIKVGRLASDPLNITGVQMPPKGGNPLLTDEDLFDIVAYVRTFAASSGPAAEEGEGAPPDDFWIARSSIPEAPRGPSGLATDALMPVADDEPVRYPHHSVDPDRPANAHIFFAFYFCMTGLHGLHVLAGMVVIAWLTVGAIRGLYGSEHFTPVDLGGLYWHLVDLIWIFLFPLIYLIA